MSAWPGKFVIGLTGNIATGKSVIRKMLEHLGAYGIDADALGHRAIARDAPGYRPAVEIFGRWILGDDEQIDRSRLARIVFSDPAALAQLEAIVHPLVRQAVDLLVRRARHPVVALEAIKLLESPLRTACDSIWVSYAPPEVQLQRLVHKRGMNEETARQRIIVQSSQDEKLAAANVIIRTDSSFEETWRQVLAAWKKQLPVAPLDTSPLPARPLSPDQLVVDKARPRQAAEIAGLINRITGGARKLNSADVMALFGEKAFFLLQSGTKPVGVLGCQVENLVARVDDVYLEANLALETAMHALLKVVESTSRDLQCEASLLFLPPELARHHQVWSNLGYEARSIQNLGVRAWQEAAQESMASGEMLFFKQLRKDRVLRPV
jgi:dephospho-CoA kinase